MTTKKRILIVDDDDFMRETLTDILLEKGYEAEFARDGYEAIEKVDQKKGYAIILLDLKMEGMDGYETYRAIKEKSPETRTIIMTAYSQDEIIKNCIREGAFGVLHKPLDIDRIVAQIDIAEKKNVVMVVEDDESARQSLEQILREHNYHVMGATNSEEAIRKAIQIPPHILILDVKLPTLNGGDIYLALKDLIPDVHAVLMTGFRDEVDDIVKMCLENGAHACLSKPLNVDELLGTLQEINA